jgi:hypothetical protein
MFDFPLRTKSLRPPVARRVLAALAAAGYVATIIGYPQAAPRSAKAGSEAFPCQNHACGCTTAEECWGDCCCFTPGERIAWVARRHVKPPKELTIDVSPRVAQRGSCDSHAACRDRECEPANESGAAKSRSCCAKPAPAKAKIRWTAAVRARGCRGLATDWVVFNSPIAPPPVKIAWRPAEGTIDSIAEFVLAAPEVAYAPPTPPA